MESSKFWKGGVLRKKIFLIRKRGVYGKRKFVIGRNVDSSKEW